MKHNQELSDKIIFYSGVMILKIIQRLFRFIGFIGRKTYEGCKDLDEALAGKIDSYEKENQKSDPLTSGGCFPEEIVESDSRSSKKVTS